MAEIMVEEVTEEPRFPALRTISLILKVLAVIVAIAGIISAIGSLFAAITVLARVGAFFGILITAAIQTLLIWAAAEILVLLTSLEHNTFVTKETLKKAGMRPAA